MRREPALHNHFFCSSHTCQPQSMFILRERKFRNITQEKKGRVQWEAPPHNGRNGIDYLPPKKLNIWAIP
ncbi:UNVERIFIED_CONTAM: hypothetical protein FKN15_002479 [Acipenser sinensis]